MKKIYLTIFFMYIIGNLSAQVGINTSDPKVTLDVNMNSDEDAKLQAEGIIPPRLTLKQVIERDSIYTSNQTGAIIYVPILGEVTTAKTIKITDTGYYYFDGSLWQPLKGENIPGGTGTNSWYKVGTTISSFNNTDDSYLKAKIVVGSDTPADVNGGGGNAQLTVIGGDGVINDINIGKGRGNIFSNMAIGTDVLKSIVDGVENVGVGYKVLSNNTGGNENTALGYSSLIENTSGNGNTALGNNALFSNKTGYYNVAVGYNPLLNNISGQDNIGIGNEPLLTNTSGVGNVAIGYKTLFNNQSGAKNIAIGYSCLNSNIYGNNNIALGNQALSNNNSGYSNMAAGNFSLFSNTSGLENIGLGDNSLYSNSIGSSNVAIGSGAMGYNNGTFNTSLGIKSFTPETGTVVSAYNNSTAIGANTVIGANNATALGYQAKAQGINSVALGNGAIADTDNTIVLGNASITTIKSQVTSITALSDKRFKKDIQSNVPGIKFIMKLNPVTYYLDREALNQFNGIKNETTAKGQEKLQTGFIAQEVEQAIKSVNYDFSGLYTPINEKDFYGLKYSDFVAPLVKSVQEQQIIIENLEKENTKLLQAVSDLEERLTTLEKKLENPDVFKKVKK